MLEDVDNGRNGMTSKQFIKTLKNIKEYCTGRNCDDCIFKVRLVDGIHCQFAMLGHELRRRPLLWNLDAIERTIRYE